MKQNVNKSKRLCLGEGEGRTEGILHKHIMESPKPMEYERTGDSLRMLLKDTGVLTHDEHDRMVIQKGAKVRSYHQVEYNPHNGRSQRVFD